MSDPISLDVPAVSEFHAWAHDTFGEGLRTEDIIAHIRSELLEILDAPTDTVEWADVIILAINGATRAEKANLPDDASTEDIAEGVLRALLEKMQKNYRRTYALASDGLMRGSVVK